jgi:hypothetical protein
MSFGSGKEILIKSVVQAIPTYSMALLKLPRGLCEYLTLMIQKFLWGSKKGTEDGVGFMVFNDHVEVQGRFRVL